MIRSAIAAWSTTPRDFAPRRPVREHPRARRSLHPVEPGEGVEPGEPEDLWADHLPRRSSRWFAVVDGRGRVPWTRTEDGGTSLLVVACRTTPGPYLARLRRQGIPYLIAGTGRVELEPALVKLRARLDARCVVSEAGGGLNGALLRAGLVDELHVVTVPAVVGGLGTPSIADGAPLGPGAAPVRLRTVDVTVGSHGSTWAHYEVLRDEVLRDEVLRDELLRDPAPPEG